jgi:two-component system sporulation sensor kinase B
MTFLQVRELLSHVFFVIFPIFLYAAVWVDRMGHASNERQQRLAVAMATSVSLLLCLAFPVFLFPGSRLDLRSIAIFLGFIYGGYFVGIVLLAEMLLFVSIAEASFPLLVFTFFAAGMLLLSPPVRNFSLFEKAKKTHVMLGAAFFLAVLKLAVFFIIEIGRMLTISQTILLCIGYPIIQTMTAWCAVYLVEAARERASMRMEIQSAEKLNVVGQLAASVAHEIRNPMTVIRGFMQLFKQKQFPEDQKEAYLDLVISEMDRTETIINDYLSLAKPQEEVQQAIDVKEQVRSVIGVLSSYATLKASQIHLFAPDEPFYVLGNPDGLNQVLINLIKNGIEAMPDGGTITIAAYAEKDKVVINVYDHGVGMTKEQVQRLGTPFYSTKEKGTGLGLTVCFRIIEAMNGKIVVTSEQGKGTNFSIRLPRYEM